MRKPRKGMVERFLRHLILSRDFHTSLILHTLSPESGGKKQKKNTSAEYLQPKDANNLPFFLMKHRQINWKLDAAPCDGSPANV